MGLSRPLVSGTLSFASISSSLDLFNPLQTTAYTSRSSRHFFTVFTIKDLGIVKYFLGMEIARGESGTCLNQRKYILDLLKSAGLLGCRSVATPLPLNCRLFLNDSSAYSQLDAYRRLVGRLLYLNLTRPDITYAIQQLSQFVATPSELHWDAAIHVLKYLKGCPSLGLFYPTDTPLVLNAYSDADWGTCPDTRRSLTGYCIILGGSLISWHCKKHATVFVSSAEAEYWALSTTVREMIWLSHLYEDFRVTLPLEKRGIN
ncbi:uncharacterized mitochondrial protein AtMg00810-like [Salvia miltiorrhiza]|uniref:uncharacterized mitochondrial protein AtMg00810-like n=1 Tax=Salvia miltiorrhiza TaxID=226208 RepID=UPI0025AB6ABC|nr:uncharacterized mitochondrial protein AtMg00810-like [Salvia miltiorrhiza]XP_057805012.1 uncharacterized mitochondrial protein AtMg00810-like [Salvia miltiorrhiza]